MSENQKIIGSYMKNIKNVKNMKNSINSNNNKG